MARDKESSGISYHCVCEKIWVYESTNFYLPFWSPVKLCSWMLSAGQILVTKLTCSLQKQLVKLLFCARSKIFWPSKCISILVRKEEEAKEEQFFFKCVTVVDSFPDISFQNFPNKYKHRNATGKIL